MSTEDPPPITCPDEDDEISEDCKEAVNSELEKALDDLIPLIHPSAEAPTKEYLLGYLLGQ